MATPPPKPVEPIFSRSVKTATMVFESRPVRRAAAAPSSWNKPFLFGTVIPPSTQSTVRMSVMSFIISPNAVAPGRSFGSGRKSEGRPPIGSLALRLRLASSIGEAVRFRQLGGGIGMIGMVVLATAGMAPKLLLDLVGRRFEGRRGRGRPVGPLQDDALGGKSDDLAGEAVIMG